MDTTLTIHFEPSRRGERLDKALAAQLPELSRTGIQRLIEDGFVTLDGEPVVKAGLKLEGGEVATVRVPPPEPAEAKPEDIPLKVLFESDDVLVIDKPAGMVVHPAAGHPGGTLVNAVLGHDEDIEGVGGEGRPGIVHRLDKETSGLILVAKNDAAYRHLQTQFKERTIEKAYLALVDGAPPTPAGRVEAPIGRDPRQRKRMAVVPVRLGREAVTEFRTVEAFAEHTLLEALPRTGRTHQIRVHLAFVGCPIVGDRVYGRRTPSVRIPMPFVSTGEGEKGELRFFLHAHRLSFTLPGEEARQTFTAPLPPELEAALREVSRQ